MRGSGSGRSARASRAPPISRGARCRGASRSSRDQHHEGGPLSSARSSRLGRSGRGRPPSAGGSAPRPAEATASPGRPCRASERSGPRVRRHRAAPVRDQLDEPICSVQAQLHPTDATTNVFVSTRRRPEIARAAEGPQGRVRGQLRERPDRTSPPATRAPLLWRWANSAPRLPSQCFGRTSSAPSHAPHTGPTPPAGHGFAPEKGLMSVRGAGASGGGTAGPSLSPGPPSWSPFQRGPRSTAQRTPSPRGAPPGCRIRLTPPWQQTRDSV